MDQLVDRLLASGPALALLGAALALGLMLWLAWSLHRRVRRRDARLLDRVYDQQERRRRGE